jgi:hypothetical protein
MNYIAAMALTVLLGADPGEAANTDFPKVWMAVLPFEPLAERTGEWEYVQQHLDGIKFWNHQIDNAPLEKLRPLIQLLAERRIDIIIENNWWPGPVDDDIGERGAKLEVARIDKVVKTGGKVKAIDIDDPVRRLFYPEYPTSMEHGNMDVNWCVRQLISYMKGVRKAYPDVDFYVITNFPNWGYKDGPSYWGGDKDNKLYNWGDYWPALQAIVATTKEAGVPVRGVTVDNPYDYAIGKARSPYLKDPASIDWIGRLLDVENYVRKQGLEFNVIFNAETSGGKLDSDQVVGNGAMDDYYKDTLDYIKLYRRRGGKPDRYIIQSWYKHPIAEEVLPESGRSSFTALVKKVIEDVKKPK